MTWGFEPLRSLSDRAIEALIAALRDGPLAHEVNRLALRQILGNQAESVWPLFEQLREEGFSAKHISVLLDAIRTCGAGDRRSDLTELVLSGPDVEGVPTSDTLATFNMLVEEANDRIVLVGYAVHNGKKVFHRLAERMAAAPNLEVVFCLDVPRKLTDSSLEEEIVRRFGMDFRERHWPWSQTPTFYYYRRSLSPESGNRASLHAKCVIADRRAALVTSANFTQAAQTKNIEAGILTRDADAARRLDDYFAGLIKNRELVPFPLPGGSADRPHPSNTIC